MPHIRARSRLSTAIFTGALAGLALAGCKPAQSTAPAASAAAVPAPADALPLTDASAPALVQAPAAQALAAAPPAAVVHVRDASQSYAYADQAATMGQAFANAPPDYTYDYQGVRPWAWLASDGALRLVEPLAGANRYYYYQAGADTPFLVRDADYSYGYDHGQLSAVYDRQGRIMPPQSLDRFADLAGRYLERGRGLYQAAKHERRIAVAAANWRARRTLYAAEVAQWGQQQDQDAAWRAYHDQHLGDEQARWAAERYRREAEAARYAQMTNDRQEADRDWQAALAAQASLAAVSVRPTRNQPGYAPSGAPPAAPAVYGANPRPADRADLARANAQAAQQAQSAAQQRAQAQTAAQQQALARTQAQERAASAQTQQRQHDLAAAQAKQQALSARRAPPPAPVQRAAPAPKSARPAAPAQAPAQAPAAQHRQPVAKPPAVAPSEAKVPAHTPPASSTSTRRPTPAETMVKAPAKTGPAATPPAKPSVADPAQAKAAQAALAKKRAAEEAKKRAASKASTPPAQP